MYLLNTNALNYEILIRSFELRLLKSTGYGLSLKIVWFVIKISSIIYPYLIMSLQPEKYQRNLYF